MTRKYVNKYLFKTTDAINEEYRYFKCLELFSHPNLNKYCEPQIKGNVLYIYSNYIDGISLHDLITNTNINAYVIKCILYQILIGLKYIHENCWIHKNITSKSIMIDKDGTLKICHFLSKQQENMNKTKNTFSGVIHYMSPEFIDDSNGYTIKTDIWSFGMIIIELLYGETLFYNYEPLKTMIKIINELCQTQSIIEYIDNFFINKSKCTTEFDGIITKCLNKNPDERPSIDDILSYDCFANLTIEESNECLKKLINKNC